MPRNGSSVYSLPAGNPVIAGTVIATTWANTTLTDIATALTNSLSTDGSTASVSLSGKTLSGGTFSGPTVTGILTATGGQIAFPAVQVPSANVNTLDDYEEGTWTPTLTFVVPGTLVVAYSSRNGIYTKIGNLVSVIVDVATSTFTVGTATGNLLLTGLPFTSANTFGACGLLQGIAADAVGVAGTHQISLQCVAASTQFVFSVANNTDGSSFNVGVGLASSSGIQKVIRVSTSYEV